MSKHLIVGLAVGALVLTGCSSSDHETGAPASPSSSVQAQASRAAAAHAVAVAKGKQQAAALAKAKTAAVHARAVAHADAVARVKISEHAKAVAKGRAHRRAAARSAAKKAGRQNWNNGLPCINSGGNWNPHSQSCTLPSNKPCPPGTDPPWNCNGTGMPNPKAPVGPLSNPNLYGHYGE